jgi:glycosyltransferase involved in cell wall biosynthesis
MKILHIISGDLKSGAAKGAYLTHQALLNSGIDSYILTDEYLKKENNKIISISKNLRIRIQLFLLKRFSNYLIKLFYPNKKENIFSTGFDGIDISSDKLFDRFDIINLHWVNGLINIKFLKNISKPLVWTLRDLWPMTGGCHHAIASCNKYKKNCGKCPHLNSNNQKDISYKIIRSKKKLYPKKNIKIVGLSKWITNCAKKSSLFKNYDVFTIGNIVNSKEFYPMNNYKAKKQLGLPYNKKIVTIGAENLNDFYKGFDLFLNALKILKINDIHVVTFGNLNAFNSDFHFYNFGYIKKNSLLRKIYAASDVFVSTSRVESFGKTVAESMACGTPSVIFENTGSEDIITHKCDGYIAKKNDITDIAKGIEWILSNKYKLKIRERAIKKINTKFNSKVIAQKYISLYKNLLYNLKM